MIKAYCMLGWDIYVWPPAPMYEAMKPSKVSDLEKYNFDRHPVCYKHDSLRKGTSKCLNLDV